MRPLSCPPAPPPPGPFTITAPHIISWLVWLILAVTLVTLPFGGFKTIQHFWRGVQTPEQRWVWWLRSLRNLCFTVGYPPWGLSTAWMAAIEARKQSQADLGCPVNESVPLFSANRIDGFLIWQSVGVGTLVAFVVLEILIERKVKKLAQSPLVHQAAQASGAPTDDWIAGQVGDRAAPAPTAGVSAGSTRREARDTWLYRSGMLAIVLASGAWPLIQGITDLHAGSTVLPRAHNIREFALPKGTLGSAPLGIVAGPDGNLWFTVNTGQIGRITPSGTVSEYPLPTPANGRLPEEITTRPDGNLWFTDAYSGVIGRITPTGAITLFPLPQSASWPRGIAAGPDGNLWFTEFKGNRIGHITPGGTVTEFSLPYPATAPWRIVAGPDGNLWFIEAHSDVIGRITPAGTITQFPLPPGSSPPGGIATGADGALWFTEPDTNQIGRITPAGTVTQFPLPPGSGKPWKIAAGPDGNLWFADIDDGYLGHGETTGDQIGCITPRGSVTLFPLGGAVEPDGIAAGPDGAVWFTEGLDNKIGRLSLGT
jgi:streptogramin lyase